MNKKFLLWLFICLPLFSFAQDIQGTIVDQTNSPIIGAYVIHLQSEHHAHSNEFGTFFMNEVAIGDTLQIIHLGYETLIYPVESVSGDLKIELQEAIFGLDEIVVGKNYKKSNIISYVDLKTNPVSSAQEILRSVPGLFIGQHAGGGKAEQIFLRGFDIDHGTDVAVSVDGMPVNMVSHAHGQGYADLHFIIPESVERIDFGKGPYFAQQGNFATAGYVQFSTKDKLENSSVNLEYGQFNTFRALGMFKLLDTEKHNAYVATEYKISDGPFESSQNFMRTNFMAKYSGQVTPKDRISVLASHFNSIWDASGQVPQRAVDQGLITRFGAIDDTEGGRTSRTNLAIEYTRSINDKTFLKNNFYYSLYDFELYSNFTFFLNDQINGDQIRQKDDRSILGFESVWNYSSSLGEANTLTQIGVGLRNDVNDNVELSRTRNRRTTITPLQLGDINENNIYAFANTELDFGDLLIQPGLRFDYFHFNYVNSLDSIFNRQTQSRGAVSPKLNFIYNVNPNFQLFLKSGIGFHSNDTRVVLNNGSEDILPAAYGVDLGTVVKPAKRLLVNMALWYLFLEQEFVYVGDEGIVEPSGQSRRLGLDFGLRYQFNEWLFFNGDFNYSHARSVEEPSGQDFIPLAPQITSTAGLNYKRKRINASLQSRFLQDRPANEDNSIIAEGYLITDLSATYSIKNISLGFSIDNLFNTEWNETQFATESRLRNEDISVEEIHFTPGTPFFIKGILSLKF